MSTMCFMEIATIEHNVLHRGSCTLQHKKTNINLTNAPTGEKGWGNSGRVTQASLHSFPATLH